MHMSADDAARLWREYLGGEQVEEEDERAESDSTYYFPGSEFVVEFGTSQALYPSL
jgi:hypothetical protein